MDESSSDTEDSLSDYKAMKQSSRQNKTIPSNYITFDVTPTEDPVLPSSGYNQTSHTTRKLHIIGWMLRFFLLLCTLFCAFLSFIYSIGQLYQLSMTNFWCKENYELNEIHDYNRNIASERGNSRSCYNIGSESSVDESALHSNSLDIYDSTLHITVQTLTFSVMYGVCALLFLSGFCYHLCKIIQDLCCSTSVKNDTNKSNKKRCLKIQNMMQLIEKRMENIMQFIAQYWSSLCGMDQIGWISRKLILEMFEISLQSMVLLEYGGNSIYDDNIKLAEHPHHVINFAIILGSNCIINSVLWISYALCANVCFGIMFSEILTVLDIIFDSLYVVYPLCIAGSMSLEVFALYKIDTVLRFAASFSPQLMLFIGLTQSLSALTAWQHEGDTVANYSFVIDAHKDTDSSMSMNSVTNGKKRNCFIFLSLIFLLIGISMIFFVTNDISNAERYCTHQKHDIDGLYPELALYNDLCQYKVYKLFDKKQNQCECRLFVLSETKSNCDSAKTILSKHNNSTQFGKILMNILQRWNMLQVVIIENCINFHGSFNLEEKETFSATHMQAFGIYDFEINKMDGNISQWKDSLAFLELSNANLHYDDINWNEGISALTNLKYLSLYRNNINIWPNSICNMKQLLFLELTGSNNLISIDECVNNLQNLQKLYVSWTGLHSIPASVWRLPHIQEMQFAFTESITLQSSNILNITQIPPKLTQIYFQGSTLCNQLETVSNLSISHPIVYSMLIDLNACKTVCEEGSIYEQLCLPWAHGNGICNDVCNVKECDFDFGDCNQLCDFNECDPETHWDNGICDAQCNSTECEWDKGDCYDANKTMECNNGCDVAWLDDNFCDQSCMESDCRETEATDCTECIEESPCYVWSFYFSTIDANNDGFLQQWEVCNAWNLLKDVITLNSCNDTSHPAYDLNGDGQWNAYEAFQVGVNNNKLSSLVMDSMKAVQINCSVCMDHPSLYNA